VLARYCVRMARRAVGGLRRAVTQVGR
jgi:hypothetical protein